MAIVLVELHVSNHSTADTIDGPSTRLATSAGGGGLMRASSQSDPAPTPLRIAVKTSLGRRRDSRRP
jgi:hypothetical protein